MNKGHFLVCLGIGLSLITGCKENIDLGKVDTRAEVDLGLVLPIGSAHATFADLLSTKTLGENFVLDENGVLTYKTTADYKMDFHSLDLAGFTATGSTELPVPGVLSGQMELDNIPITFSLNINKDLSNERIDSIIISGAVLTSSLSKQAGLGELDWNWIEQITLHLGEQMYSPKGKDITIYAKGSTGDFGHTFTTMLEDVSLSLMKDKTLNPNKDNWDTYNANALSTWDIKASIKLSIPDGQTVTPGSLAYNYSFAIVDYKAVWGYFKPGKDLVVKDTIILAEEWDLWKNFRSVHFPFSRPSFLVDVNTSVSATVAMNIDEIFTESLTTKEKRYATFNSEHQGEYTFEDQIGLDPTSLGQRATYLVKMDNTEENGRFDKCFEISPDLISFSFNVAPYDVQNHPQMRLINDTVPMRINLTAMFPFAFNPGVYVSYVDTIREVNFTQVALDSLLKNVEQVEEVKKADLNLYIHATNDIPLDVTGKFVFQDEQGQDLHILDSTLVFKANDTTTYVVTVHETDFDRIASTKKIAMDIEGSDESIRDKAELYPIEVKGESGLKLFIGFAGNVDAILNFNNKKQ